MRVRVVRIDGEQVMIQLPGDKFMTVDWIDFPVTVGQFLDAVDDGSDGRLLFLPAADDQQKIVINNTNTQVQSAPVLMKRYRVGKWLYVGLAILLGTIGAHKFALGKTGMGVLYIVFCWTAIPTLAGFIEGIAAACKTPDAEGYIYFN